MKNLLSILTLLLFVSQAQAQELNCQVTVIAPQVTNVDQSIFEAMEQNIEGFMNTRRWTNDNFDLEERIECNLQLTINEAQNQSIFQATLQVQSSRPIYNTDYNSPIFSANDGAVQFEFLQNSMIDFSLDQHRDNLSSVLAYYAYMIVGMDYDSFSLEGGTDYFLNAQNIVANAQNASEEGWRASENKTNRFWLVENILSQSFKPLRKCMYRYHRHGFDVLYHDSEGGRKEIADVLVGLRSVHKIKPSSYNIQMFLFAKSDEIVNLFQPTEHEEKVRVYNVLKLIDPGSISKYEKMMK